MLQPRGRSRLSSVLAVLSIGDRRALRVLPGTRRYLARFPRGASLLTIWRVGGGGGGGISVPSHPTVLLSPLCAITPVRCNHCVLSRHGVLRAMALIPMYETTSAGRRSGAASPPRGGRLPVRSRTSLASWGPLHVSTLRRTTYRTSAPHLPRIHTEWRSPLPSGPDRVVLRWLRPSSPLRRTALSCWRARLACHRTLNATACLAAGDSPRTEGPPPRCPLPCSIPMLRSEGDSMRLAGLQCCFERGLRCPARGSRLPRARSAS